jgi:hypothetical protein
MIAPVYDQQLKVFFSFQDHFLDLARLRVPPGKHPLLIVNDTATGIQLRRFSVRHLVEHQDYLMKDQDTTPAIAG